jgi:hypothetical protein
LPIKRCIAKKKKGFKYGDEGTCYTGQNGKIKAAKQGLAIITSGYAAPKGEREKLLGIISKIVKVRTGKK